VIKYCKQ